MPKPEQLLAFLRLMLLRISLVLVLAAILTPVISYTRESAGGKRAEVKAATSSNLNYQARLLNASGNLVPDGYYNLQFKLYNASSGGTNLWTETYYDSNGVTAGNDNRVRVVNGYLSVNLASQTAFPAIDWDQDIWLTINVGGSTQTATPTWDGEMSPRVKLTAVPYAFQANNARTLNQNQGTYAGTLDFATLTANRAFVLPDTTLATTGSPGTLCVFNGSSTNCPVASGSAFYIQNTGGSATPQGAANFNIQATNSSTNGTIGGIIRGAAGGQTVDLFQLQDSAGAILTAFQADGKLVFGPSGSQDTNLYRSAANTLRTDDALSVGSTLAVTGNATFDGNVTLGNAASDTITFTGVAASTLDMNNNLITNIGNAGTDFTSGGGLTLAGLLTGNGGASLTTTNSTTLSISSTKSTATAAEGYGEQLSVSYNIADSGLKQGLRVSTSAGLTTGTLNSLIGGLYLNTASGNGGTVTQSDGLWVRNDVGTGATTTTANGLNIQNGTGAGTITHQYGIYIQDMTKGATSDYGIRIDGADTQVLWLGAGADNTDAANGIAFGASRDTNLYRSAANTLYTDDAFTAAGLLTGSAGATISGGTINLNNNASTNTTNIGTGSTTGAVAIGGGSNTLAINTTNWDVSSAGAISGLTGYAQASGNFLQSGTGTFDTGTGAVSLNGATSVTGTNTFTVGTGLSSLGGNLDVTGSAAFKRGTDFSTTGTTNNASFGDVSLVRLTGASTQTITGVAGGRDGELLTIINAAGQSANINNNDTNSTASNRIITGTGGNISLPAGASVSMVYDAGASFWRVTSGVAAAGGAGVNAIGAIDGQTKSANGAVISGTTLYLQTADATNVGLVSAGTQTFGGDKTFNGVVTLAAAGTGLSVTNNASVGGTLGVTGAVTLSNTLTVNGSQFTNQGSTLFGNGALSDFGSNGAIGTAAATVDVRTSFTINQTTSGRTLSLPNPTDTSAGRVVIVSNIGSTAFIMHNVTVQNGKAQTYIWNGSAWTATNIDGAGSGATSVGAIDSQTKTADGGVISGNSLFLQTADASNVGLVSASTQTFGGDKTFNGVVTLSGAGTGLTVTNNAAFNGNVTLGNAASDTITFTGVAASTLDMNNNLITNIGNAGTDFTSGGGLTLAGLLTGNAGATIAGALNLNNNASTNTTNIGTGSTTGAVAIGGGSNTLAINTTNWDVSSAGAISGLTGYAQASGNFAISGTGTFSTGTGAISLNGATTINSNLTVTSGINAKGYSTTNTSNLYSGQHTLLGRCTITVQYNDCRSVATIVSGGDGNTVGHRATVDFRVKQQNALGGVPYINLAVTDTTSSMLASQFNAVTVTNDGSSTVVELYGQVNSSYQTWWVNPLINTGTNQVAWQSSQAYSASLPAGTVTAASYYEQIVSTFDSVNSVAFRRGTDFSATGTTHNANLGDVSLVRLTGASAQTITGITGGRDGEVLTIVNAAGQAATINNNDTNSTAANRIITGTGGNISLPAGASITLIYDAGASFWRVSGGVAATGGVGVNTIGAIDSQTKSANGAVISGTSLFLQTADASNVGLVSTGTQTFAGAKTFNGVLTAAGGIDVTGATTINTTGTATTSIGNATGALTLTGSSGSSFVLGGTTISTAEFTLLDGKNTTLVDVDDAVNTAITGTGALSVGSIASGFGTITTANTITGTTLNGTTGINTGAGAGTQRIDASGNLVNIGNITASGNVSAATSTIGNQRTNSVTRTLPTTVGDTVDIGTWTFSNGAGLLQVNVTVPNTSFSQSKQYTLPIYYNATTGAWRVAAPLSSTGTYSSNDFSLEVNVTNNNTDLRLRRAAGTTAGTAYVQMIHTGNTGSDSFTPSTTVTSAPAAVTTLYNGTPLTQLQGMTGIGTLSPASALLTIGTNTTVASGGMIFGTDTNLYRSAADTLRTDDALSVGATLAVTGAATLTDDLAVNGGDLTSTATTFNLLNTGVTTALNIGGAAATINLGPAGATATTLNFAGGSGATGCTIDGATGNLTCSGNISSTATSGTQGWWSRSGTTLQPATAGDNITTTGNISTTSSGTITSAGLLTASSGLSVTNGGGKTTLQLTSTSADTGLTIGSDTNLYRGAANLLKTDDSLEVTGTTYSQGALTVGTGSTSTNLTVRGSSYNGLSVNIYSDTASGYNFFQRARGTFGSATATQSGDYLGSFGFRGYDGSAFFTQDGARFSALATENHGVGAQGTALAFYTAANGTGTASERMRIDQSGYVRLGSSAAINARLTFDASTTAAGGILFGADTTLYRNAADSLYTDDAFTAAGLLTGSAGATISGGTISLNNNSNNTTNINTGTSTGAVNIGNASAGVITLQSGSTINLNAGTIVGSATSQDLFNTVATTINIGGAATTMNIGPSGATAASINIAGGSGATGCTVDGATGNLTCSGNLASGSNQAFLQNGNSMGAQAVLGTNDSNSLAFETNNVTRWILDTNGHLTPNVNDAYDIGSNTNRVRDIYAGPGTIRIGTATGDEGTLSYDTSTNTFQIGSTGSTLIQNTDAASVTSIIQGATGQTANLLQIKDGSSTPVTVTSIAADGSAVFKVNNDTTTGFQIQNNNGTSLFNVSSRSTGSANLITNPSFEVDTSGWSTTLWNANSITRTTTSPYHGTASAQVVTDAVGEGVSYSIFLPSSTAYTLSMYVKGNAASQATIGYYWNNGANTGPGTCTSLSITTSWTRISCSFTTNGGMAGSRGIYIANTSGGAQTWYIDAVQLETGLTMSNYAEGEISINAPVVSSMIFRNTADSTGAFQIQQADGTSLFKVDSTNGRLAVGPSAATANGVLTIGTNTTTASGGLYFGTDTNLYRSAADTLRTNDAFTADGLVTASAGLTVTGTTNITGNFNLNTSGNNGINIGTGTYTGNIYVGNSAAGVFDVTSNFSGVNAIRLNASNASGGIDIDSGTNGITIDSTGAISLDSTAIASNFGLTANSASNAVLTLSASNAGAGTAAITLTADETINLNAGTIVGTATTQNLFNTVATTLNIGGAAGTMNIGPGGATASTINIAGGSGATGCTVDGATGNLACSGSITSGSAISGNKREVSETRTLPTTVGDTVDIGTWTFTQGTGNLQVTITVPNTSFGASKTYNLPMNYNATTNNWRLAAPLASTGAYSGNDFNLEVNSNALSTSLRIRRAAGTTAGTAYVQMAMVGVVGDTFTASTATTSAPAAVTTLYGATQVTQLQGYTGIGTISPANGLLTVGTDTTAATGGMYFGTDTNLYRSAANTLRTDDALSVGSTLAVTGNSTLTGTLTVNNTTDINTSSTTALQVRNGGTTALVVDTTNTRVGIGGPAANGVLTVGTNTTAASGGLYFGTDTNLYRGAVNTLRTDDTLMIANTSTTALRVTDGSVNDKFVVDTSGNITSTVTQLVVTNGTNTGGIRLLSGAAGTPTTFAMGRTAGEYYQGIAATNGDFSTNTVTGDVIFKALNTNALTFSNGTTSVMNILGGNVGIGVRSTTAKLDVRGTTFIATSSATAFRIEDGSSNGIFTVDTATAGGGTVTTSGALTVTNGSSSGALRVLSGASGTPTTIAVGRTASEFHLGVAATAGDFSTNTVAGDVIFKALNSNALTFSNGTTSVLNVLGNNVGIGVRSATAKLDVRGDTLVASTSANAFRIQDGSFNTLFNANTSTSLISITGNLQFSEGATRTINTQARTTNAAGSAMTIAAGDAGSGASAFQGGQLTLQGGNAAGTGNANGGNVLLTGGTGVGTGARGLVVIDTPTFTTTTNTNCGTNCTITQSNVDSSGAVIVNATASALTITLPDPTITTAGRIVYITAANGSNDFTLSVNGGGTGNLISMRQNTTATMIWNGSDWTAAGASSSTTLQAAYDNTLTSAGGAELVLNAAGGNADGLTIRNNATTPIIGSVFEVQSSIGTNLLSVNNNATELAANGGAETSGTFSTNWTAAPAGGTITRHTTLSNVATGLASTQVVTTTTNHGVRNNLASNPATSTTYMVSFTGKLSSGTFTTLEVLYTPDGGTTTVPCTTYSTQTLVTTGWSKVTCTITTGATSVTNPDIIIRQTDATGRTFWVDNLSFTLNTSSSTPSNVQVGGGLYGGGVTLLTLDRASSPPVANGNSVFYGSMYYDTTSGRIQCYEADGWGACGSAPDNFVNLVPEYSGAVLNGTGVGTMSADFCANQSGVLQVNDTLCSTGQALNYYRWTSPQATQQTYSIYVTYQLPAAFKQFQSDSTVSLTARTDNTSNGVVTYQMFRSEGGTLYACGTETTVTSSANTWQTVGINGNENSGCGFSTSSANTNVIFKINVKAQSNANVYVGTLSFTTVGQ